MKHNLHKNAYLVSDNTIPALQKIFKTEWEPLGYKLNAKGTTDIERVTERCKLTGKYLHAVGYRLILIIKIMYRRIKILLIIPTS